MSAAGLPLDPYRRALESPPAPRPESARHLTPGTRVAGRYIIAQRIGQGGCGDVYAAVDTRFGVPVAVKVASAEDGETRERFEREARLGNRLGQVSAGFVRCHDWGALPPRRLFLVMDLVEDARPLDLIGGRLEERLERLDHAALLVAGVHDLGIVHRDVKPANFLVGRDGRVYLSDFGLAKDLRASADEAVLTQVGDALGTPAFMAPEQFERACDADERSDVYALGVMLYLALTGRYPYEGDPMRILAQQLRVARGADPRPRPRHVDPGVHPAFDALCERMLSSDPMERVPSARLFVIELRRARDELRRASAEVTVRSSRAGEDDGADEHEDDGVDEHEQDAEVPVATAPVPGEGAPTPGARQVDALVPTPPGPAGSRRLQVLEGGRRTSSLELVEQLASGARGVAWLARRDDGLAVVVKEPLPHARGALDLEVEARLLEQLDHPNIIKSFGRSPSGGLCLERAFANPLFLQNGPDARPRLFKDPGTCWYPLPPGVALELGRDLLGGLEYLHGLGFVHHDVKLANFLVMIDRPALPFGATPADVLRAVAEGRGRGVLIDLGGARSLAWLQDRANGRADDQLVPPQLTPLYSPPEALLQGEAGDAALGPAVDVYAAGLVLYAMVTGHMPYDHLPGFSRREREAGAYQDLARLLDVKAAERCGDVSPITRDAIEDLPLHDVRLSAPGAGAGPSTARRRFGADLLHLITALTDRDPRERPSAGQARELLQRSFRFHGAGGRERQGVVSMNPLSNRLVDAARPAGAVGGLERISVRPQVGPRRGGRVA